MFLRRFDPFSIDPLFLVNREKDFTWLYESLSAYLTDPDPSSRGRLSFCILGEKGVGKTILTRAALRRARGEFSDRAIFLDVDCRRQTSAKQVIDAIAKAIVDALYEVRKMGTPVSNELVATAQILAAITRFDDAELRVVHQYVEQFKAALGLKGEQSLLKALSIHFQISLDLTATTTKEMTGKVRFDEARLCDALGALFHDIRASGLDVVLYIDNMDELSHHYRSAEERQKVRRDTEVLLGLRDAPIVFVLNMRTYYSGILPREIANRRVLRRLPPAELLVILHKRIEGEGAEVKRRCDDATVKAALHDLAEMAPTPLAFLAWFKVMFEEEALSADGLAEGASRFLETYYSTVPESVWRDIARVFDPPSNHVSREVLLGACGGNEALLSQAVDRQGVLPKDFWDPTTYYTLDPELHIIHPKA